MSAKVINPEKIACEIARYVYGEVKEGYKPGVVRAYKSESFIRVSKEGIDLTGLEKTDYHHDELADAALHASRNHCLDVYKMFCGKKIIVDFENFKWSSVN
jgi:hypothetical protein